MGSYNFFSGISKEKASTAQDAYEYLVQEAIYEYGHNPYSGTIATTDGFRMFTDFRVESKEDLARAEGIILDRTQKWEKCECVEYNDSWQFIGWVAS